VLEAIEVRFPGHRHIDLDTGMAVVTARLAKHRLTTTSDPVQQARELASLNRAASLASRALRRAEVRARPPDEQRRGSDMKARGDR
jgi:hypothetical protein